MEQALAQHHGEIAAVILEPMLQATGGIRIYHPEYLRQLRQLCDEHGVLLIFDEIATGFGRTGKLFAAEHAGVSPDILCIGKAMTGGCMSLAATMTHEHIAMGICANDNLLMHGPTFMGNPLACAAAVASIDLLLEGPWQQRVAAIETQLVEELTPCSRLKQVADVRTFGAIGVVETREPVVLADIQKQFVEHGVWVRPFGRMVYIMPPFIINESELGQLTRAIHQIVSGL